MKDMPQLCSEMIVDDDTVPRPVATEGATPPGRPAITADSAETKILSTVRALLGTTIDKNTSLVDAGVDSLGRPRLADCSDKHRPNVSFVNLLLY